MSKILIGAVIFLFGIQAQAVHPEKEYPCYTKYEDQEAVGQEIGSAYLSFIENYGNDAFEKCNRLKSCKAFNSYGVLKKSARKIAWEGVHLWVKVKNFEDCLKNATTEINEMLKYKVDRKQEKR